MMEELCIMEDCSSAKRIKITDKEFNPPVEMMVNDYDDERTLDEEEALETTEDPQAELSNLQKEGDMPLEELLARYGYTDPSDSNSSEQEVSDTVDNECEKNCCEPGPITDKEEREGDEAEEEDDDDEMEYSSEPSQLIQLYQDLPPEVVQPSSRSLRLSRPQSEEEDEDYDYSPDEEEWKKTIMVGSDYQAWIPEGLCRYDDALPYENEDKLLWDPCSLTAVQIENYLVKAQEPIINSAQGVNAIPMGAHTRDDEQALYLLLQCGYNIEEALRRRRMNVVTPTDTMSLWSEEECRNFENGLRTYGKNFHLIQQNKVRTRSVGELVQFYYLWKKTERHDIFANKARLEKKKYTLHPGITDYMDRFLEEQESGGANSSGGPGSGGSQRDRSSSPNIQCLIYGDRKRHQRTNSSAVNHLNVPISQNTSESMDRSEGFRDDETTVVLGKKELVDSCAAVGTDASKSMPKTPSPPVLTPNELTTVQRTSF